MRRIDAVTAGGDAPGMNATIHPAVRAAVPNGLGVMEIERGCAGLTTGQIRPLSTRSISGIINHGGAMLRTARCVENGKLEHVITPMFYDRMDEWIRMMKNSVGKVAYYFSSHRMMRTYVTEAHL